MNSETESPTVNSGSEQLVINQASRTFLAETARWAKILSIIGFVGMGFMIIGGFFFIVAFSVFDMPSDMPFAPSWIGLLYIVLGIVYLFPLLYLFRFATKMKDALVHLQQSTLDIAFSNLKSLYKFIGIFMIITLVLYAVILLGTVILMPLLT